MPKDCAITSSPSLPESVMIEFGDQKIQVQIETPVCELGQTSSPL